jgi:uncharacterized membrane protein YfcA
VSPLDDLLVLLMGFLTGIALGALGSGGSSLAMPAFAYALGMPVKSAVAASLVVVGMVSLLGAAMARRRCVVFGCPGQEADIGVALLFAAGGLVGSYTGARAGTLLPDSMQMLLFGVVVSVACIAMFRRKEEESSQKPSTPAVASYALWSVPPLGLAVGLLTGLVGVGGGFLIVPALTLLVGIPVKKAMATSLWVIAANCATGLLGYVGRVPIAWIAVAVFIAAAMPGMMFGQYIARITNPRRLQKAFAGFLLLIGLFTVTQTLWAHRLEATKKSDLGYTLFNGAPRR